MGAAFRRGLAKLDLAMLKTNARSSLLLVELSGLMDTIVLVLLLTLSVLLSEIHCSLDNRTSADSC
jgi:hypothetical protein